MTTHDSNATPSGRQQSRGPHEDSLNTLMSRVGQSLERQREATARRQKEGREALGLSGPGWDSLVGVWRQLRERRLETLWEYAAVASSVANRFGDESLRHFALQVGHPERRLSRGVEAYRASHVESPPGAFVTEAEYTRDLQLRLIDRGWQVKREAVMGFGRCDLMANIAEGRRRRHIQVIEAKLSADWRAAAQALGQLQFYRGGLAGTRDIPDYGLWFACPERPDDEVLTVLRRHGVGYIG